jgi:hypothetical protein
MKACEIPRPELLPGAIALNFKEELDFERAKKAALGMAKTYYSDPLLVGWFDRKNGVHDPQDVNCEEDGTPAWLNDAKSHGGNLTIDINHEEYVFIFRGPQGLG